MKITKIGRHLFEIYDSIDELPVERFHKFNKYLLVDAGVGSSVNDINEKIDRIIRFINKSDNKSAIIELDNLRQALYVVSNEMNPKHLAYLILIKSIDGKEITDLSEEGLRNNVQKKIEDQSITLFDRLFKSVKKKIDEELNLYFPDQFDDASVKEYYDRLRKRALLQLNSIIEENDNEREINIIDDFLLTFIRPRIFSGKKSVEIEYDKQFESMCLLLTKELSINIANTSVLQFYNAFEYLKTKKRNNGR